MSNESLLEHLINRSRTFDHHPNKSQVHQACDGRTSPETELTDSMLYLGIRPGKVWIIGGSRSAKNCMFFCEQTAVYGGEQFMGELP